MKNYLYIILAGVAAVRLTACAPENRYLRADTALFDLAAEDTSDHIVTVEASASWMYDAVALGDWMNVRYDANNPDLIHVNAEAANETAQDRADTIVLVSGDGLKLEIPVKQRAIVPVFSVAVGSSGIVGGALEPFAVTGAEAQLVVVEGNLSWEAILEGEATWVTASRGSTAAGTANQLSVTVTDNPGTEERTEKLIIRPVVETYWPMGLTLEIRQLGAATTEEEEE